MVAARSGKTALLGLPQPELRVHLAAMGLPAFRARQLVNALLARRLGDFSAVTTLPKPLRRQLEGAFSLASPRVLERRVATDGLRKYRLLTEDGRGIEAVYIPDVGRRRKTNTLCVSSQTGCSVGCRFCFTAQIVHHRSLSAAEIIGQVLAVQADLDPLGEPAEVTNVVFMGMGEPLLNAAEVTRAARILLDPDGLNFSRRRVTISTSGIVPQMRALGEAVPVQLAVSLNATTDEVRTRIMPINKKWPLSALLAAMRDYPLGPGRRITVEYVLLGGVNDSPEDVDRLPRLLAGIPVKVNLLPLNPHDKTPFSPPPPERVAAFRDGLARAGLNVSVRTARGQDVAGACGQLGTLAPAPASAS